MFARALSIELKQSTMIGVKSRVRKKKIEEEPSKLKKADFLQI
jgi:hypothetical protein